MPGKRAFTPLEIGIPNRVSGRFPERHGERSRFAGSQTDVRKKYRSFLRKSRNPGRDAFRQGRLAAESLGLTGFTLIELLVVIAIIALLLAILLPSLNRTRDQAKGITCRNNLNQIGLTFILYTDDNEGKFPRNGGIWIVKFLPYIGGQGDQDEDYRKMGVYNCPMYPNKEQTLDYVINSWKDGVTEYIGYTPVSDFRRHAEKIFLADNEDGSWRPIIREEGGLGGRGEFDVWLPRHLPTGSDGNRRVAQARHRNGCNGAFMDGHSDWIQAEKMTEQMWQPK